VVWTSGAPVGLRWHDPAAGSANGFEGCGKPHGGDEQGETHPVVPGHPLLQDDPGKNREDDQGDALLDDLELVAREFPGEVSAPVGRHLEAVLEEGDSPGNQDRDQERLPLQPFELEMPVPGAGHEDVGAGQE
jgi:hypothetical protein